MILNKYFLEENTRNFHTTTHQTIHQHTPPCTHFHKLRTWWVAPESLPFPFPNVRCPMSDVDAFGMWQIVKISSNHFSLK